MAGQAIDDDEEWYKATYTVKLAGCDQGSSKTFTVDSDKEIWQSANPATKIMEKTRVQT